MNGGKVHLKKKQLHIVRMSFYVLNWLIHVVFRDVSLVSDIDSGLVLCLKMVVRVSGKNGVRKSFRWGQD